MFLKRDDIQGYRMIEKICLQKSTSTYLRVKLNLNGLIGGNKAPQDDAETDNNTV